MSTILNYKALGAQIRMYRQAHHFTQDALAREAGLSLSFLGHIERGTRKASIETLIRLSCALNVTPDTLLADSLRQIAVMPYDEIRTLMWAGVYRLLNQLRENP